MYRVVRANTNSTRLTTQQYLSFFVQDTIRVGNRLTFRPGVRYEQQDFVGNLDSFKWSGNWAPRIGGTFDLTGDGRGKIYANYGRFYAKIPNDLAARALSADEGITRADYFDASLTQPIAEGVLAGGTTTHFRMAGQFTADFDPDSGSTYLNEYLVGVEFEALPGRNVGVRFTHRDFGQIIEDIGTPTMVSYCISQDIDGNPVDFSSAEYFITNPGPSSPSIDPFRMGGGFDTPIHDYDAVAFGPQAVRGQLVAAGVLSLGATVREFRGLLPERQWPVGPLDHVAVRLPEQRPELHGDRRTAVRLQGRHQLPWHEGRRPTPERSAAPAEDLRELHVR